MTNSIEPRPLTSAFESPTFGEDSSFHVEQPVGSMSISPCGRDVVLASKEGLHVIDLDSPYSPPRYLPHRTPWEVADVQWSPFAARDYWVASTSNQKALVWNLAMKTWQNSIEFVLHAHSRAITDINFSAHHPDRLATCAVDSFIHCWDLRTPLRPAISLSDWFAGATQVKWNRQDPHVIASSHDRFLRIWDDRMGAYPIKSIEAHNTKIYGVDWNRVRPGAVVTCSLDKTIKFWDYTVESDVPEKIIRAPFPVWRARNTPFGWGVLAMPQRGNSDLHLYSRRAGEGANPDENLPLVHTFPGHKGQVKEFLWRPRGGVSDGIDCREFQLVSWGTDRELRLHRVNPDILQRVGYEKGKSFISNLNVTRTGAVYRSFRDENDETVFDEAEPAFHGSPYFSNGIGMNAVSTPYGRAWKRGGRVDSRVGMRGRSNLRADTNPISWMRGVKISGWDIETLGDEITHVGEKFTKVYFDSVDIRQRKATISLHGPWGTDGVPLFLKVDIRFPVDYPKNSMPSFSVQKTAGVTDELASNISAELRTIAETYLSRKRGCLEGIVRYLLGESTLEESIAWILGEAGETVKSPVNGELEGESSDEDEVGLSHSQELGMSSELLRPPNANVMVPVAKACGALWALDGRLVCFFPPNKDKSGSFLEHLGFKEMTRLSRADKVFEGFGRLQANSPGPQIGGGITGAEDASDDSDDSDVESSSSSGSSDILSGLQTRFPAPRTWRSGGSLGFHRPRSTDNSQMSTIGGMATKSSDAPKNVISIHDFSDLLPAKRELARKYRISGRGTDVCAYNASAALDAGYHELARIWDLVKLVLHNREAATLPGSDFARPPGMRQIHRRDSAVDLTYDIRDQTQGIRRSANGAVSWGDHPFGGKWLVPSLLEHFEKIGDIQMLAMLSCVLHGSKRELDLSPDEDRSEKSASRRREQQSFSLDFYSGNGTAQVKAQSQTPLASTPKESHATPITHSSGRSSAEFWRPESTPPYSTGTTPPLAARAGGMAAERKPGTQNVAIASSPDQQSQPRSGSGLGSVLASSFTRSFNFGPSSASPPASVLGKKKNSGNNSYAGGGPGAWTTGAFTAKPASAIPDYLTTSTALTSRTHSDTESERPQPSPRRPAKLKVAMKNQDTFDNGRSQNLFLDPNKDWVYRSYRAEYANLLSVWGLPVQQSEILKIGGSVDRPNPHLGHQHFRSLRAAFSLPTDLLEPQLVDDFGHHGLDIHQHCLNCGNTLDLSISSSLAGTDVALNRYTRRNYPAVKCLKCDPIQPLPSKLPCIICGEMVERMLIPCLNCGHVCCFACHKAWFSKVSGPNEDTGVDPELAYCPSGCGCNCSEHTVLDAPMFRNLSSAEPENDTGNGAHSPTSPLSRIPQSKFGQTKVGQHEADLDAWQASPFATLARGLGGGLSRGLRAEDIRKPRQFVPKKTSMNRVENG